MQTATKEATFKLIEQNYREQRDHFIRLFARRVGGAKFRADDIVQEGYSRALRSWEAYDHSKPMNTWIYQIMNNAMRDERKEEQLHGMVTKADSGYAERQKLDAPAIPKIIYDRVVALIKEKKEPLQTVLYQSLVIQCSPKEVARLVDSNANNVRQQVFQFRQEIRDKYRWSI